MPLLPPVSPTVAFEGREKENDDDEEDGRAPGDRRAVGIGGRGRVHHRPRLRQV